MQTDYLSPKARHDRHRYERAQRALGHLLGEALAEDVMEGRVDIDTLPGAEPTAAGSDDAGDHGAE